MPRSSGSSLLIQATATGDGVAYTSGDAIGTGALQFSNAAGYPGACVLDVTITLPTAAAADIDLALYGSNITGGTNNSPFTEAAGDNSKSIAILTIPATSFKAMGGGVMRATLLLQTGLGYSLGVDGGTLYGQMIVRAALTLTSPFIVYVGLGVHRD